MKNNMKVLKKTKKKSLSAGRQAPGGPAVGGKVKAEKIARKEAEAPFVNSYAKEIEIPVRVVKAPNTGHMFLAPKDPELFKSDRISEVFYGKNFSYKKRDEWLKEPANIYAGRSRKTFASRFADWFRKVNSVFLIFVLVIGQVILVSGYEAHIVSVTAHICNYSEIRSMGFWKNHPEIYINYLPQTLGEELIDAPEKADAIFRNANAFDMANALMAQLLAMKFNVAYAGAGEYLAGGQERTLDEIVSYADLLLIGPGFGRDDLEAIKDLLDNLNNLEKIEVCSDVIPTPTPTSTPVPTLTSTPVPSPNPECHHRDSQKEDENCDSEEDQEEDNDNCGTEKYNNNENDSHYSGHNECENSDNKGDKDKDKDKDNDKNDESENKGNAGNNDKTDKIIVDEVFSVVNDILSNPDTDRKDNNGADDAINNFDLKLNLKDTFKDIKEEITGSGLSVDGLFGLDNQKTGDMVPADDKIIELPKTDNLSVETASPETENVFEVAI